MWGFLLAAAIAGTAECLALENCLTVPVAEARLIFLEVLLGTGSKNATRVIVRSAASPYSQVSKTVWPLSERRSPQPKKGE
jgi:hypothetical protein